MTQFNEIPTSAHEIVDKKVYSSGIIKELPGNNKKQKRKCIVLYAQGRKYSEIQGIGGNYNHSLDSYQLATFVVINHLNLLRSG